MDYELLARALMSVDELGWELTIPTHKAAIKKAAEILLQEATLTKKLLEKGVNKCQNKQQ